MGDAMMNRQQIENRICALESEIATGRAMMADLDARRAVLRSQMLRVSGAIRVLREILNEGAGAGAAGG